ncbi:hypothetical protein [Streptomyces albogriseolus]|uniref:hypothetical protein n=1 Tax=Streptomyces albogriseolus TaxID=1887 RepID=UPI003D75030D
MAAEQLPDAVREFTDHLRGLLERLDRYAGWCLVFWQRDPDGMRACLEGREPPPWDVVESLLQDLAAVHGPAAAEAELPRVRALHAETTAVFDARPGARQTLRDRLDVMLREQRYAADRRAGLTRRLAAAANREEAEALGNDLAWAEDDHRRATARCAELTARMTALDAHDRGAGPPHAQGRFASRPALDAAQAPAPDPVPPELRAAQQHVPPPPPAEEPHPAPSRKRRRGGARFAGMEDDGSASVGTRPAAAPELPVAATAARGARFAGAAAEAGPAEPGPKERTGAEDLREVARLVRTLTRLRREGRSGEAHVLLNEAAYWPAARFPLLAADMERAGHAADWATLLWEAAATLPAERLVAAADALTAAGRAEDGEQILRQGVVRPADEIGHAALALADGTRHRELRALLDACVRMRTPQDAARTAAPDPGRLVPLLLTAARAVSEERHWDVLHALRVAGLAA